MVRRRFKPVYFLAPQRLGLFLMTVSWRDFMLGGEREKIFPVDAVLTSGEFEGN
jgi:hypothetical protein